MSVDLPPPVAVLPAAPTRPVPARDHHESVRPVQETEKSEAWARDGARKTEPSGTGESSEPAPAAETREQRTDSRAGDEARPPPEKPARGGGDSLVGNHVDVKV